MEENKKKMFDGSSIHYKVQGGNSEVFFRLDDCPSIESPL
jgi:hypothetical protein